MCHLSIVSGKAEIDDKDNHHSPICWRTRLVRNAFLPSITLSSATVIAKPIRTSNPILSIPVANAAEFIKKTFRQRKMDFLFKAVIAGTLIALASWLSEKRPELAGFIIALPMTSIIALTISQIQTHDSENSIIFAKSIIIGVPLSYLFFLPFFLQHVTRFGFWAALIVGLVLLSIGYFIHQYVLRWLV